MLQGNQSNQAGTKGQAENGTGRIHEPRPFRTFPVSAWTFSANHRVSFLSRKQDDDVLEGNTVRPSTPSTTMLGNKVGAAVAFSRSHS
jgi:hypothetical protein